MPWPVHPTGFFGARGDQDTYRIERSLRFNSADSAYLNRTPASAGNRKTWTWNGWVKRANLSSYQQIWGAYIGSGTTDSNYLEVSFTSDDLIQITGYSTIYLRTTQVFRDPSAWYMLTVVFDTTSATANNRVRLYVNGVEVTAFGTRNNPTQNSDLGINGAYSHGIGAIPANLYYLSGYLTEINFIDGQALTPSSFGETDAITGRWKAKAYSGTYGTNGFYLSFKDNTSTTTLGYDDAGSNDWTLNNFSVTAGAGNDSLVDSPTNYGSDTGVGGEVRGNYCTLNSIRYGSGSVATMADGNLYFANTGNAGAAIGTFAIPPTGKWYWEAVVPTQTYNFVMVGVVKNQEMLLNLNANVGILSTGYAVYSSNGNKFNNGTSVSYMATTNQNTVMTIAYDADTGSLYVGAGGSWANGSGSTNQTWDNAVAAYTGLSGTIHPAIGVDTGNCYINFGQRPFAYTAPTGFKALCTTNLPTPTIKKPSSYMDVVTFNGSTSGGTVSGLSFSPDFVWGKNRDSSENHVIIDSVRGGDKLLASNTTGSESINANMITSFNSDGYTYGVSLYASARYVNWAWDEAPIAGMDIVSYTGNGTTQNVSHSLGVTPKMVIVKNRDTAATPWNVYHAGLTAGYLLSLNQTSAQFANTNRITAVSSSNFSVGSDSDVNQSTKNHIAYLFAEVEGFSKFGSYTGNGSADGPFVWCGFRPRWVMVKRFDLDPSGNSSHWWLWDAVRQTINPSDLALLANTSGGDISPYPIDILSNGFKLRDTNIANNPSGGTHIFAAFAESPFKYARAR